MKEIYVQYKMNTEIKNHPDNIIQMTPILSVKQTPIRMEQSMYEHLDYSQVDFSLDEKEIIMQMQETLSEVIVNKLTPSIESGYSRSQQNGSKEVIHALYVNLILPDEKLMYESKETVLKDMVEDGYKKVERYMSESIRLKSKLIATEEKLKPYVKLRKSIWGRLKFLFKGAIE